MSAFTLRRGELPADRFMIVANDFMRGRLPVPIKSLARCLLGYLLSLPAGWDMDRAQLDSSVVEGRDAVSAALNELEGAGYLQRNRSRDESGGWLWDWHVTDDPLTRPLCPSPESQSMGTTSENTGNQQVGPSTGNPSPGNQVIPEDGYQKTEQKTDGEAIASRVPAPLSLVPAVVAEESEPDVKKLGDPEYLTGWAMRIYDEKWRAAGHGAMQRDVTESWVRATAHRFDVDPLALIVAVEMAGARGKINPSPAYRPAPIEGTRLTRVTQAIAKAVYDAHRGEVNFTMLMARAKTALRAGREPVDVHRAIENLIADHKPVTQQLLAQYAQNALTDRLADESLRGKVQA